jgi:hypothetical protein
LSKFWEKFSTWTFCKNIFMVFLNSPCRETPKNALKKKPRKKKVGGVGGWVWDLVKARGGPSICFWRPLDGKDNDEDSENGDAGGELRAFGADADAGGLENKDENDRDDDSENGDAGGVLRASGADTDGLENKDGQGVDDNDDDDDDNCGRRSNTDGRGGKPT